MQILANERALLQTLDFDLVLKHPPQYLFQFAKGLQLESGEKIPNQLVQVSVQFGLGASGRPLTPNELQLAYRYVSDSFQTLTCLEYRPMVLAVALLHLATTMLKLTVVVQPTAEVFNPDSAGGVTKWWELFVPGSSAQMKGATRLPTHLLFGISSPKVCPEAHARVGVHYRYPPEDSHLLRTNRRVPPIDCSACASGPCQYDSAECVTWCARCVSGIGSPRSQTVQISIQDAIGPIAISATDGAILSDFCVIDKVTHTSVHTDGARRVHVVLHTQRLFWNDSLYNGGKNRCRRDRSPSYYPTWDWIVSGNVVIGVRSARGWRKPLHLGHERLKRRGIISVHELLKRCRRRQQVAQPTLCWLRRGFDLYGAQVAAAPPILFSTGIFWQ